MGGDPRWTNNFLKYFDLFTGNFTLSMIIGQLAAKHHNHIYQQRAFPDLSEIHARLFDHRPILQGHTNFFVKEFEEKRGNHEQERLKKLDEEIKEMKDGLIPEAKEGMDQFLANITAKLKVATEVCKRVEEKENNIDTDLLEKERERRKSDWTEFLARQYETCDQVDAEFSEQADIVAKHYEELEKNLVAMNNSTP